MSIWVEDLILQTSHASTLLVGNSEAFLDCVVVCCMHRVKAWSPLACLAEFRRLCFPYRLRDLEQFIEAFDCSLVDIKCLRPESFQTHQYFTVSLCLSLFLSLPMPNPCSLPSARRRSSSLLMRKTAPRSLKSRRSFTSSSSVVIS